MKGKELDENVYMCIKIYIDMYVFIFSFLTALRAPTSQLKNYPPSGWVEPNFQQFGIVKVKRKEETKA